PLGDIQLAHDLDTGDDGGMMLLGDGLHGLLQHAVNTIFDHHGIALAFDVNVAGALLQGRKDGGIHQPDDGADVAFRRDPVNGEVLVGSRLFLPNHVQHKALAGLFQDALRLLGLLENIADLAQSGYPGLDSPVEEEADLVNHHQLAGVGNRNPQNPLALFQGNKAVAEHQIYGDRLEQLGVQMIIAQIDELAAITHGQVAGSLLARGAMAVGLGDRFNAGM